MPKRFTSPCLFVLTLCLGFAWLPGCSGAGKLPDLADNVAIEEECTPQVPVSRYRTQAAAPMGTLVITVVDEKGNPLPETGVEAVWSVYTGTRCRASVQGVTDANGVLRFERLKPGPYMLFLGEPQQEPSQVEIEDGQTTAVTLTKAS